MVDADRDLCRRQNRSLPDFSLYVLCVSFLDVRPALKPAAAAEPVWATAAYQRGDHLVEFCRRLDFDLPRFDDPFAFDREPGCAHRRDWMRHDYYPCGRVVRH